MRLLNLIIGAVIVLTGLNLVFSSAAFATIVGSGHDFSAQSWNSTGEICVVCHTPHNALTNNDNVPLWNREFTTSTFTLYSSPTLTATVDQPSASSKACLSCHDGTVALDSFGGATGSTLMTGPDLLDTDLSNDHPISFIYDAALAGTDGGLHDPTTQTVSSLPGKTIDQGLLIGQKVECASCHDVHNNKGDAPTSSKLLIVDNSGSALCLTCHNK